MHPRHLTGLPRDSFDGDRLRARLAEALRCVALLFAMLSTAALAAGNVIQYTYDAAGNIIGIQRTSGPPVSISGFSPASGPIGTAVTINGVGFSATPANNAVTFNGTAASVASSTTTSISTTVPTGTTTGRIRVTVAGVTATSAQDFVVTTPGAPTITSFTPTSGASGTSVSVTGTNFDTGGTTVKVNGVTATSSTSTTTALGFTVPGSVASGRISATTSVGTGYSASDFIVPPPGVAIANIATTLRISAGSGNAHVSVPAGGKSALVLFDGTASTFYSLQLSNFGTSPTTASVSWQVVKPDNTAWQSGSVNMSQAKTIRLPALPVSGTYTLVLTPSNATLDTLIRLEADPVLTIDGAAGSIVEDYPLQSSRFIFNATAGQRVGVGASSIAFLPSPGSGMTMSSRSPLPTALRSPRRADAPPATATSRFVAPGTAAYGVNVTPALPYYVSGSVLVSSPASGTLTADTSQAVTLSRVGQDAAYTFSVSSGDSYAIDVSSASMTPSTSQIAVAVLNPSGTQIASSNAAAPANIYIELGTLSTAGTYTVVVDPDKGATGTFKITAKQGPVIHTTDSPLAFAPPGTSESARFRFTATAGQNLSVAVTGIANSTGTGLSTLTVYAPNGSTVAGTNCGPSFSVGKCHVSITNTVAGTYSAVFRPPGGVTITGNVVLSEDLTAALTAGTPQSLTATRVGQGGKLTFSGTAGDSTSFKVTGFTISPSGQSLSVVIYRPDGVFYTSSSVGSPGTLFMNLPSLPQTGTYSVILDPSNSGGTWSGSFELDPGTLVTINGSTVTLPTGAIGETLRFRISATSGQRIEFGLTGLHVQPRQHQLGRFQPLRPEQQQSGGHQLLDLRSRLRLCDVEHLDDGDVLDHASAAFQCGDHGWDDGDFHAAIGDFHDWRSGANDLALAPGTDRALHL